MTSRLRAVIADDEALARRKLRDFLAGLPDVECVGEAADGNEAVRVVREAEPDVLFLDIRMPGASGMEVLDRLEDPPYVVFTTAYDRYAVAAFELQALDYLLKPFGAERLRRAVDRAKRALAVDGRGRSDAVRTGTAATSEGPITRLFVRERGKIVPVSVETIRRLEAGDEYVALYVEERRYLVSLRLREFEARLDPERFVRVSRSDIVNLDFVTALVPYDGTRLAVQLDDGTSLVASRSRSRALRRLAV
jgi:two-component system, LytTR family, response regulator